MTYATAMLGKKCDIYRMTMRRMTPSFSMKCRKMYRYVLLKDGDYSGLRMQFHTGLALLHILKGGLENVLC